MLIEITYPFPIFNSETVEAWEWIFNFVSHFTLYVIIYPCRDLELIHEDLKGPSSHAFDLVHISLCPNDGLLELTHL